MTLKAIQKSSGLPLLQGPDGRTISKEELPNLSDLLLASWCCLILRVPLVLCRGELPSCPGLALVVLSAAAAPLQGAHCKLWQSKLFLPAENAQAQGHGCLHLGFKGWSHPNPWGSAPRALGVQTLPGLGITICLLNL